MDASFSTDHFRNAAGTRGLPFSDPGFLLLLQVAAFWSVWQRTAARFLSSGDPPWELVPLIFVVFFAYTSHSKETRRLNAAALVPAATFVAAYAGSIMVAPPLISAVLAMVSLTFIISQWRFGNYFHPGIFVLLLLSLPLTDSLNFFLGYPMRVIVGDAVVYLLNLQGLDVYREGVTLIFGERMISIDAPCSGVKMLWFGSLLATILSLLLRLDSLKLLLVLPLAFIAIVLGNILRASALFYVEGGLIASPGWMHSAAGAVGFAFTALMIVSIVKKISGAAWRK